MASSRATTSAVSLEDWDALAPLSERSRASVSLVTETASEKPLPARLARSTVHGPGGTRPGTPSNLSHISAGPSTVNLLRRATSRADLASSTSSLPGTPGAPRSPAAAINSTARTTYFSSSSNDPTSSATGRNSPVAGGHTRMNSNTTVTSGLGMQLYPASSSKGSTPQPETGNGGIVQQDDPLAITSPIETTQDFLDWFQKIEQNLESEQELVFKKFKIKINSFIEDCEEIFECLEDSRGLIKEMEANYKFVEDNSRALQLACEAMLEDQKHLIEVTNAINARLEYFKELEVATRTLSQPGGDIVLQEDFLGMLDRLDICLDFLRRNRNYRDAEVYLIRFQQCLTRAMTLIKMHFLTTINDLHTEVSTKMASATKGGKQAAAATLSETALNALLYSKFSAVSATSRVLLNELEKRAITNPDEYGSLLQECFYQWFNVRSQLLSPNLAEEVRRMDLGNTKDDLVRLARTGCAYLRNVCAMEWSLFREFFPSSGQNEAYQYLETLCDHLYDSLRPRILHEPKLDVLCELCNVLQALISLDGDPEDEEEDRNLDNSTESAEEGESSFEISIPPSKAHTPLPGTPHNEYSVVPARTGNTDSGDPDRRFRFSYLLNTILHDTQTRLVFRSQYIVEAEILNYVAKPEDLDYPEKLLRNRREGKGSVGNTSEIGGYLGLIGSGNMGVVDEDGIVVFKLPPDELMEDWYPTLRKTLWVLSKLHSYVNTAIFEDFAGEAVTLCRQSLSVASEKLASRSQAGGAGTASAGRETSKLDAQLFLVRHLLILKEMIRSIDLSKTERGVDFSNMTDALSNLLRNTSNLFNPNALFQIASRGLPSFKETIRDSKRELDGTLKLICEDLITHSSLYISAPIRSYLTRCQAYLSSAANTGNADLTSQPWASEEEVLKLHDAFMAGSVAAPTLSPEGQGRGEGGSAPSVPSTSNRDGGGGLEEGMREVLEKMNLYLDDEKTVNVLLPPIQAEVLEHYTTFYHFVKSEYDFASATAVANAITSPSRVRNRLKDIADAYSSGSARSSGADKARRG